MSAIVYGGEPVSWHRIDLLRRVLFLDVDQRKCLFCRIYVQMGRSFACLVGKWIVFPDSTDGCSWDSCKAKSPVSYARDLAENNELTK